MPLIWMWTLSPIRSDFQTPFEAELVCHDGRRITLIGAHLKSKAPWRKSKDEAMLISIANRRNNWPKRMDQRARG